MLSERRDYYRLPVEGPMLFKIVKGEDPEEESPSYKGLLKDVSLGGVRFGTNRLNHGNKYIFAGPKERHAEEYKPQELLMHFSLPGEKGSFFSYCRPQWHDEADLADPFDYYVGAKYTRGRKADFLLMHSYIQKHADKEDLTKYSQRKKEIKKRKEESKFIIDASLLQKRAVAAVPLRYKIISYDKRKESRFEEAETHNLSLTGICAKVKDTDVDDLNMAFDKTPAMPNSIALEVGIPGQKGPVKALGEVRWSQKSALGSKYHFLVGIRFLRITERDKSIIADFIKDKPDEDTGAIPRW